MRGHPHASTHHLHAIHVRLHCQRLERRFIRHAVPHIVKPHRLQLVRSGLPRETRVEPALRQRGRRQPILLQLRGDRNTATRHRPPQVRHATLPQVRVQCRHIGHARHRRRPLALQPLHAVLHVRLFIPPRRHAEQRREVVVIGQGPVLFVQPPVPAPQDLGGHGLRVVPPHFSRDAAEVLEGRDHPVQNRLGPLRRQGDHERRVGVGPRPDQDRHLAPSVGEIHHDLPEVELHAPPGGVVQWDERLPLWGTVCGDIALHLGVASLVALFLPQPSKNPRRGVPLLHRLLFVRPQDLVDPAQEWSQFGSYAGLGPVIGARLRTLQDLPDLLPRVAILFGQRPDALARPVRLSNPHIFVQLQHPSTSVHQRRNRFPCASVRTSSGWVRFARSFSPQVGPFCTIISTGRLVVDAESKATLCQFSLTVRGKAFVNVSLGSAREATCLAQ